MNGECSGKVMEKKEEKEMVVLGLDRKITTSDSKIPVEEEEDVVLPGFRFHPTDEELVGFYLRRKVEKKPISIDIIKQIDIYKHDPWDLPKVNSAGDQEGFFFCLRGRKYRNSIRPNRVTGSGFWKATGIDKPIYSASDENDCIGLKKSLVYYRGSAGKGTKTDWMMHEFRLPKNDSSEPKSVQEAEVWTICKIFKRTVSYRKYPQDWKGLSSKQNSTDSTSKTCSLESHTGDDHYMYFGASNNTEQSPKMAVFNYYEDKSQLYVGQWNPLAGQPPMTTNLNSSINPVSIGGNSLKDGNWDELGRVMDFVIDPAFVQDFRHFY